MVMHKVNRLTPEEHAEVTAAVTQAERMTDGEIVTIVADQSDSYHDAGLHWAVAASFLSLSLVAMFPAWFLDRVHWLLGGGWERDLPAGLTLTLLLGLMIAVFLAVRYVLAIRPLRMAVTPKRTKARRVRRKAIAYFKVGAERRTMGRTGILIYLSLDEHRAEIVADEAIASRVGPEVWGEAMVALIDHVREGRPGKGMAEAVRQVGVVLAEHFPKSGSNPNELPDRLIEL
jgi:putative membrane protein